MNHYKSFSLGLLSGGFFLFLIFYGFPFVVRTYEDLYHGYAVKKTQKNGVIIVAALEAFQVKEGEYPDCLAQLMPKYLSEIPPSFFDVREWYYYRTEDTYFLGASKSYPACHYLPAKKRWAVEY